MSPFNGSSKTVIMIHPLRILLLSLAGVFLLRPMVRFYELMGTKSPSDALLSSTSSIFDTINSDADRSFLAPHLQGGAQDTTTKIVKAVNNTTASKGGNQEPSNNHTSNATAMKQEKSPSFAGSSSPATANVTANAHAALDDNPDAFFQALDWSNSPRWALFYNVYVPRIGDSEENHFGALDIVREQLGQIRQSHAAAVAENTTSSLELKVFYNSIATAPEPTFMDDVCRGVTAAASLDCIHMQHYQDAFEEVTLQRVYEFCHAMPDDYKVIYMHSKGSYNSRGGRNDFWRRHMTLAVSHSKCLDHVGADCDICGLIFNPLPWIHFSGNFFTASCAYIRKLVPPTPTYHKVMDHVVVPQIRAWKNTSRLLFNLFPDKDAYLGMERYASEHWPGSHPSIRACDVSRERQINAWKRHHDDPSADLHYAPAPRLGQDSPFLHLPRRHRENRAVLLREFWHLSGNLIKWFLLYNTTAPAEDSWVWKFFPHGQFWKDAVYRHLAVARNQSVTNATQILNGLFEQTLDPLIAQAPNPIRRR